VRALVTGANGLIGANLVRELLGRSVDVRGLVRAGSDLGALAGLELELCRADLAEEPERVIAAARGCDLIFHTAVQFSYDPARRAALEAAAIRGTEHLLRAAYAAGAGRVVLTSSSIVLGYTLDATVLDEGASAPDDADESGYVRAKIRQDRLARELATALGLDLVIVCPTVSVGPYGSRLGPSNGHILAYLEDALRLTYPGGCNVVSTVDVARGHWLAARAGAPGQRYILGAENLAWRDFHALVAELAGVPPPRAELNHTLGWLAAGAEELRARLTGRPPLTHRSQAAMIGRWYWYDHGRAFGLGWRPRPARQAIAEALSWLVASPHVSRELRAGLRLHDDVYAARYPGGAAFPPPSAAPEPR
jgi:dihydroflavonol-4-reductase